MLLYEGAGEMKISSNLYKQRNYNYNLQTEFLPGLPLAEILGNNRVIIENHCGIKEYSNANIRVGIKNGVYMISGSNLKIARITNTSLVVTGTIEAIRFCGGKK